MNKPADLAAMEPLDWIPPLFRSMIARDLDGRLWEVRGNEWVLRQPNDSKSEPTK